MSKCDTSRVGDGSGVVSPTNTALVYSTYLGGSDSDSGSGIDVDSMGNAHVTGRTSIEDFPTRFAFQSNFGGFIDAFVTKLNADGSNVVYSTYIGRTQQEAGLDIAIGPTDYAYVSGFAQDIFPVDPFQETCFTQADDDQDALVAQFRPDGTAMLISCLGGRLTQFGNGIAVDAAGDAFVTGYTGPFFPTTRPLRNIGTKSHAKDRWQLQRVRCGPLGLSVGWSLPHSSS